MLARAKGVGVVFDIGANIGCYTIPFALGGAGVVHAFEPSAYQHKLLLRNVALNSLENVVVQKKAVSASPDRLRVNFAGEANSGSTTVTVGDGTGETVEAITLDDYAAENGIERVDLVKIDVEGHEPHVLSGMSGLLAGGRISSIFMELNPAALASSGASSASLVERLAGDGYKPFVVEGGRLIPYSCDRGAESLVLFERPS